MHLLIPFANCSSEGCAATFGSLKLPYLQKLLSRLSPLPPDQGDEHSLSPPHERALARSMGLPVTDGMIPWAAVAASQTLAAEGAWGFITPCHWQIGTRHVVMSGASLADFSEPQSQALLASMQNYFAEDGIALHYHQPSRWLARSDLFDALATASLDRVAGRPIANWLPADGQATTLRRLQSEMQMLLYNHPLNDQRSARGLPVVNAFWLSGTGALPQASGQSAATLAPAVVNTLRAAALNEDWPAWAQAWATLDNTECRALCQALEQGANAQLTLCGERHSQTFQSTRAGVAGRLKNLLQRQPSLASRLAQL
jgi:hypothetical protein